MHSTVVEATQRLSHCLDQAPGTLMLTDKDGSVLYVNRAMGEKTGFSPAQVIGLKAGKLWGGVMPKSFYQNMWDTIKHDNKPWIAPVINTYRNQRQNDYLHIAPMTHVQDSVRTYFIEIHQPSPDEKREQDFHAQFVEVCAQKQRWTRTMLPYVMGWITQTSMMKETQSKEREAINIVADAYPHITDALYHLCVKRSEEVLHNRFDDEELVQQAQRDIKAFSHLYNKYYADVNTYFTRHLGFSEVSQDLAHDTFVNALTHLERYALKNASYKTYLMRIAHNLLVNYFRDTGKDAQQFDICESASSIQKNGELIIMREKIKKLSSVHQQVLLLKYSYGYSAREIAELLGKSENSIKLHLSRARKNLKNLYS